MLLTPHIVRTHEITESDLKPIYIGSQQNLGVGGPPPLIARRPEPPAPRAAAPAPRPHPRSRQRRAPGGSDRRAAARRHRRCRARCSCRRRRRPAPAPTPPAPPRAASRAAAADAARRATPPAPHRAPPATPPRRAAADDTSPGIGAAQVHHLAAGDDVPRRRRAVHGAALDHQRVAAVDGHADADVTIRRSCASARVQEGSFMRAGGVHVDVHAAGRRGGRIDITIVARRRRDRRVRHRPARGGAVRRDRAGHRDADAERHATGPGGTPMGLQFRPVTVTVQQ